MNGFKYFFSSSVNLLYAPGNNQENMWLVHLLMNDQNRKLELDQQHQGESLDVKMFYIDEL